MYVDVPVLTRCCFCVPLRYGLLLWAYLRFLISIAALGVGVIWSIIFFAFVHVQTIITVVSVAILFVMAIDVVFNVVLIVGCHGRNKLTLKIYYTYGAVYAMVTIALFFMWFLHDVISEWGEFHKSWLHIVAIASCLSFVLILHIYLLILIRSEVVKLQSNCRFRFINHTADPECFLESSVTMHEDKIT